MAPVAHTQISFGINLISENGRQRLDAMLFDGIRITATLHCTQAHYHSSSVCFLGKLFLIAHLMMHPGVQM